MFDPLRDDAGPGVPEQVETARHDRADNRTPAPVRQYP